MEYTPEQIKNMLARCHADIPWFSRHVLGIELRPKQIEFVEAFQKHSRITFRGGIGFGKTTAMAVLFWWALITHNDIKVTIFGPGEGQIKSGIWNEIGIQYGKMNPWFKKRYNMNTGRAYRVGSESTCFGETRLANKDNIETARGIHAPNNFIFVDEATGVPDEVFTQLDNIFTDPNPKLCLISNPSSTTGFFFNTHEHPDISQHWVRLHGKLTDNPDITPEKLASITAAKNGVHSREYRILVLGEFPLDEEDGVIERRWVLDAIESHKAGIFKPNMESKVVWGLDPSGPGRDRSVLVKRHDNVILDIITWKNVHGADLALRVFNEFQKTPRHLRPVEICIDAIGWGSEPAGLMEAKNLPVRRVMVYDAPSREPHKYSRLRDQLWWECRLWFETGKVSMPDHQALLKELCLPNYTYRGNKIKVEDKNDIRKRGRGSPDHADALCLTFTTESDVLWGEFAWNKSIDYDLRWAE